MIKIVKSQDRGFFDHGWLKSYHSFSFGDYYNRNRMNFHNLRVINEDVIAPSKGFGEHPHNNMEIITYILSGELAHKDSMGNGSIIKQGDIQRMSAGTGITHSEFNNLQKKETHSLQIWFLPEHKNIEPSYEQKSFPAHEKRAKLKLVASKNGRNNSVSLNQDVDMLIGLFDGDEKSNYEIKNNRKIWLHLAKGEIEINGIKLHAGDSGAVENEKLLELKNGKNSEIIIFDTIPKLK
jgi:redox-sensitive bicupin YhaK (pirin superfamily)